MTAVSEIMPPTQMEIAIPQCSTCHSLCPSAEDGSRIGRTSTFISAVKNQARAGCRHCKALHDSFERHCEAEGYDMSRPLSDVKISCEYLGHDVRRVKVIVEAHQWEGRVTINFYGIQGKTNPWNLTTEKPKFCVRDLQESAKTASEWINHCKSTHALCGQPTPSQLPIRVLDIGRNHQKAFLCENLDNKAHYACLSYCWGTSQHIVSSTKTLSRHKQGLDIDALPRTLRDAIAIARLLELRYIWVDALCILQDDESDWQKESAKMAEYFGNSHITLAATKSSNTDGGLYSVDAEEAVWKDGTQCWATLAKMHEDGNLNWPLLRRGWVLQERLLSPRVLHFTEHEMVFECCEQVSCECDGEVARDKWRVKQEFTKGCKLTDKGPPIEDLELIWHRIVEEYSELELTKPSDKFPGLSGLAEHMASRRSTNYVAGLWEDTIVGDLVWFAARPMARKLSPWRAPSWSWASVTGKVDYYDSSIRVLDPHLRTVYCEVIAVQCSTIGQSKTGQVLDGYIRLRGPIRHSKIKQDGLLDAEHFPSRVFLDYELELAKTPVFLLRIGIGYLYSHHLILKQVNAEKEVFERIGLLNSWDTSALRSFWEGAEERTVTIV